jgi:hypothetical protein
MTAPRSTLEDLAALHGTDKLVHGYLPHYRRHFEELRDRPLKLLEIGIGPGGSLKMWRDYFAQAQVIGLDNRDKSEISGERLTVLRGDQSDPGLLRRILEQVGGLDIVIDDGSHVSSDVLASFHVLFPALPVGGWYVIEDLHTSYWRPFGGEHLDLDTGRTSASFVKNLIDGLHAHWIPGREPSELDRTIAEVHCYPKLVFIAKGENPRRVRPYDERMMLATLDADDSVTR